MILILHKVIKKFWKYNETIEIYHCPGDKREFRSGKSNYRSYSIPWQMNGHYGPTYYNGGSDDWHIGEIVKKRGSIRSPSEKFVFVEDSDNRGYNMGSWVLDGKPGTCCLHRPDPLIRVQIYGVKLIYILNGCDACSSLVIPPVAKCVQFVADQNADPRACRREQCASRSGIESAGDPMPLATTALDQLAEEALER